MFLDFICFFFLAGPVEKCLRPIAPPPCKGVLHRCRQDQPPARYQPTKRNLSPCDSHRYRCNQPMRRQR